MVLRHVSEHARQKTALNPHRKRKKPTHTRPTAPPLSLSLYKFCVGKVSHTHNQHFGVKKRKSYGRYCYVLQTRNKVEIKNPRWGMLLMDTRKISMI